MITKIGKSDNTKILNVVWIRDNKTIDIHGETYILQIQYMDMVSKVGHTNQSFICSQ